MSETTKNHAKNAFKEDLQRFLATGDWVYLGNMLDTGDVQEEHIMTALAYDHVMGMNMPSDLKKKLMEKALEWSKAGNVYDTEKFLQQCAMMLPMSEKLKKKPGTVVYIKDYEEDISINNMRGVVTEQETPVGTREVSLDDGRKFVVKYSQLSEEAPKSFSSFDSPAMFL
jgi:hypothetical protein